MPKEQGHFWDGTVRSSSKTAKNKSNSATLQAARGGIRRNQAGQGDMNNHMVLCDGEKDSEKDSGYSGNHMHGCMPACVRCRNHPCRAIYRNSYGVPGPGSILGPAGA